MEPGAKRYTNPLWGILWSTVIPLIMITVGLALLPQWVSLVFSLVSALIQRRPPDGAVLRFLPAPWAFLVLGLTLLTLYTEVIVTKEGMKVRVFIIKWVLIPWEDVLGLTVTPIPGGNDPKLWRFVRVRRLTPFHRLASLFYLTGPDPVLIINRHMSGYEELVRVIAEHLQEAREAAH
jgi:hypothetical protein